MDIPDKVLSEYAKEVVNHAKELAKERGATHVRGFVKAGRPSRVIIDFAKDKGADLIVVGTKGTHSDKVRHVPWQRFPPGCIPCQVPGPGGVTV